MILFPNSKINLGLHILEKRADGFHDLETVFYPVPVNDGLEIVQSPVDTNQFTISGLLIEGSIENNICLKAYDLLKKDFPQLPAVKMHLHKVIPTGAGLGGGSADGAFTLTLLNKKFGLGISEEKLIDYALFLGSDCPFFIKNKPSIGTGRGEKLETIQLDLSPYRIILVNPGIHINTGWAFSKISPSRQRTGLNQIIKKPIELWKDILTNDFESPVFNEFPEVKKVKETLYANGALYASMSGSGSTVFGIFESTATPALNFPTNYFIKG